MKRLKIIFVTGLLALVSVFGFFLPTVSVSADEVGETFEISEEISIEKAESAESVEMPVGSESIENSGVLGGITDYLESKKTADGKFDLRAVLKDLKTWIIAGIGSLGSVALSAIFAAVLGHFKNKGVINTKNNMEEIATSAATKAVKGLVANSINLDISAEVNKAVEKFMYGIKNSVDGTFDMAKNTEILAAEIAQALSKSQVLTKEEQTQLKVDADAVMAHAQKGGAVIKAPAAVVVKEEPKTVENSATEQKPDAKPKNGYTLNFGSV